MAPRTRHTARSTRVSRTAPLSRQGRSSTDGTMAGTRADAVQAFPEWSGSRTLQAIERLGLPMPERQYPLALIDGDIIHIDIAWPDIRLGVEPGALWWHGGDERQRLDQARDVACGEVGWQIVRFDERAAMDAEPGSRTDRPSSSSPIARASPIWALESSLSDGNAPPISGSEGLEGARGCRRRGRPRGCRTCGP